jgi:hypothetical protein
MSEADVRVGLGSDLNHVLGRHGMAKAFLNLPHARPRCLGFLSPFPQEQTCAASTYRASAVPGLCLGKLLIFLNCASCAQAVGKAR